VRKMLQIVAASKKNEGGSRLFATEALSWVQRILAEKVMTEQFDRVIEATGKSEGPRVKIATEEQLKEFEKSKPTSEPAPAALSSKNAPKSPPETDAPASSPASPTP
jgi:hypothetical protein